MLSHNSSFWFPPSTYVRPQVALKECTFDPTNFTLVLACLDALLSVELDVLYLNGSIGEPLNLLASQAKPKWICMPGFPSKGSNITNYLLSGNSHPRCGNSYHSRDFGIVAESPPQIEPVWGSPALPLTSLDDHGCTGDVIYILLSWSLRSCRVSMLSID